MKCMVTGAGGFIGSHLCEGLAAIGHDVTAFVHYNSRSDIGNLRFMPEKALKRMKIIRGDVQDPFFVEASVKGQDCVFHLASLVGIPYSYTAPASYVAVNIGGTLNVLEAAKKYKVKKIVHTSTSEAYGTAVYSPIDEKHPLQAQSPYSASKIGADKLAESFFLSFDLPVTIIRPFNTFGPRQSARAVIPSIISQILKGAKEVNVGSLTPRRDFNYVKDTVDGFIKVAFSSNSAGKVLNIGSGRACSIREVLDIIMKKTGSLVKGKKEKCRVRPEMSEVKHLLCDYSLSKKLVGYRPRWSFEQGLAETIEFIRKNPQLYNVGEYAV